MVLVYIHDARIASPGFPHVYTKQVNTCSATKVLRKVVEGPLVIAQLAYLLLTGLSGKQATVERSLAGT